MCKKAETLEIRFTDLKNLDVQRDDLRDGLEKSNNRRVNQINYNEAVQTALELIVQMTCKESSCEVQILTHINK